MLRKGLWRLSTGQWSQHLYLGSECTPPSAQVANIIAARAALGKNYGVILIPEGLLEHVPEVGHYLPCACMHLLRAGRC